MTATLALLGIALYLGGGAAVLSWSLRRVDAEFVRDMQRVLRSDRRGRSGEADRSHPQGLSAVAAGVERGGSQPADAPPAPCTSQPTPSRAQVGSSQHLVGAAVAQRAAPARPPRQTVVLDRSPVSFTACAYPWGSGCWFHPSGTHSCAWPASACTGAHKCGCGAGSSG